MIPFSEIMTQEVPRALIGKYRITLESDFLQGSKKVHECIRIYFNFDDIQE